MRPRTQHKSFSFTYNETATTDPCVFFSCYGLHRDLHSFPPRRSSDLKRGTATSAVRSKATLWCRTGMDDEGAEGTVLATQEIGRAHVTPVTVKSRMPSSA